ISSINFRSDITIEEKPNLYTLPQLTSSDFIDLEKFLFEKGKYNTVINNGYATISPVVAILNRIKNDPSYFSKGNSEIEELRKLDIRDQLQSNFYQSGLKQFYYVDAIGGSNLQTHYFS